MKYNIHSDKIEITQAIKDYINEKLNKLNKYFDDSKNISARVIIKVRGREQTIEVTIPTSVFTLRGEETHSNLYAAIDFVVDKLESQIRKNKTKMQSKLNNKNNNDFNFDYIDNYDVKEEEAQIVRRKQIEMKPMSEAEAILQLEILDHDFFIFKNAETNNICVLYKRKEGQYGIIETK